VRVVGMQENEAADSEPKQERIPWIWNLIALSRLGAYSLAALTTLVEP
jgi:hypothetical protein